MKAKIKPRRGRPEGPGMTGLGWTWVLGLDRAQARPPGESQREKTKTKTKRQRKTSRFRTDENPVGGMKREKLGSMDIFELFSVFGLALVEKS